MLLRFHRGLQSRVTDTHALLQLCDASMHGRRCVRLQLLFVASRGRSRDLRRSLLCLFQRRLCAAQLHLGCLQHLAHERQFGRELGHGGLAVFETLAAAGARRHARCESSSGLVELRLQVVDLLLLSLDDLVLLFELHVSCLRCFLHLHDLLFELSDMCRGVIGGVCLV